VNQSELNEHGNYLADERKIAAYRAALAETVKSTDLVLDLGAGTGLLGLLACEAGAGSVVAVEQGPIIEYARQIAIDSGFADRITHFRCYSTELDLATPVNVAVCDQIGGLVHDAGVLSHFADVRRRLLAPDGLLIPASFRIHLAPVTFDSGRRAVDFWTSVPAGFETSSVHRVAANTEWRYSISGDTVERLAQGTQMAAFEADHVRQIKGSTSFEVETAGRFDGFVGWFEAQLSPSVTLTNDPWSSDRFRRWWNFYPVTHEIELSPGDRIGAEINISPARQLVSWTATVDRPGHEQVRSTHSTFLSQPTDQLTSTGRPIPHNDKVAQMRSVLDQIDGTRTPREIADRLSEGIGTVFTTSAQLESLIANVARFIGSTNRPPATSTTEIAHDRGTSSSEVLDPGRVSQDTHGNSSQQF
jgi:SAM-dependent methyltransferase